MFSDGSLASSSNSTGVSSSVRDSVSISHDNILDRKGLKVRIADIPPTIHKADETFNVEPNHLQKQEETTLGNHAALSQISLSSATNSKSTFTEGKFRLPPRDVTLDVIIPQQNRLQQIQLSTEKNRRRDIAFKELQLLRSLDQMKSTPPPASVSSCNVLQSTRIHKESMTELNIVTSVISRKPGEFYEKPPRSRGRLPPMNRTDILEESESDNDGPDESTNSASSSQLEQLEKKHDAAIKEKMEDLLQEDVERWLSRHGKKLTANNTNHQKRLLRKWFQELDFDGSGEVNVDELQDPLLSTGILKTREQVIRVVSNSDKNGTMGIDFQEFVAALNDNKIADSAKLAKLQEMSCNTVFSMDTLITAERRKQLFRSIVRGCDKRQKEVDTVMRRLDKPVAKMSKRELFQMSADIEALDDKQQKSIRLHAQYIAALNRVLDDKKEFYAAKEVAEKTRRERDRDQFMQQLKESNGGLGLGHSSEALLFGRSGAEPEHAVGRRQQQDQQEAQRLAGYDFRRDVNVLSHPRYASAIKALCSQSDGIAPFVPRQGNLVSDSKGRAVLIKSHGGGASVESSEGSDKYKLFRGRDS